MSGGHFNYDQYRITHIVDEIEQIIQTKKNAFGSCYDFSEKILDKFREGVLALKIAQIYAQRIDWLVSGDDGEETFIKRLEEDLNTIHSKKDETH